MEESVFRSSVVGGSPAVGRLLVSVSLTGSDRSGSSLLLEQAVTTNAILNVAIALCIVLELNIFMALFTRFLCVRVNVYYTDNHYWRSGPITTRFDRQPVLHIRAATESDAALLYAWDEKPHVMAATSNDGTKSFDAHWEEELLPRSDGTEFFIAEVEIFPIGAMQIINPATEVSHYWGAVASNLRAIDIWIGEESYIGQGYGSQMMKHAIDKCFSDPDVAAILIDPLSNNIRSHRFYKRLGFVFVERRQFDETSDCFVFRLEREKWFI